MGGAIAAKAENRLLALQTLAETGAEGKWKDSAAMFTSRSCEVICISGVRVFLQLLGQSAQARVGQHIGLRGTHLCRASLFCRSVLRSWGYAFSGFPAKARLRTGYPAAPRSSVGLFLCVFRGAEVISNYRR